MSQPSIFDQPTPEEARDLAIAVVGDNADQAWLGAATDVVDHLCSRRAEFTADDIWDALDAQQVPPPHEGRALGAVMVAAARAKWCESTGTYQKSRRASTHARPIVIWRSLRD